MHDSFIGLLQKDPSLSQFPNRETLPEKFLTSGKFYCILANKNGFDFFSDRFECRPEIKPGLKREHIENGNAFFELIMQPDFVKK